MTGPKIVPVSSLDWPGEGTPTARSAPIQRAGLAYLDYESRLRGRRSFLHFSSCAASSKTNGGGGDDGASAGAEGGAKKSEKKKKERDLFALSEEELKELSYYEILGDIPMHSSSERIKRAYRRMCLRYHPDKTGRGEDDYVFLAVKGAFDSLSDPAKRRSYDSTVDFDDSIPKGGESEGEFYKAYGPVFERNLRFASFNDPAKAEEREKEKERQEKGGGGGGKKKKGKKGGRRGSDVANAADGGAGAEDQSAAWLLGDDTTSVDKVHSFYDLWTHFESWRDFTLKATEQTEHDVDMADSRDEKRWMAKEIDRKARKMKQEEVARIALLVERAMAADPRLRRERERLAEEKKRREEEKRERKREEEKRRKEEEARRAKEKAEKERKEKEERAQAKAVREAEKKQMRKARQLLRKSVVSAYQSEEGTKTWDTMEDMNDDVELLCDALDLAALARLSDALGSAPKGKGDLTQVRKEADVVRAARGRARKAAEAERDRGRRAAAEKEAKARAARATRPFTKEELSALAKAVKKYPPGGANRWDAIALFVNNLCKLEEPRTKEECIERYNAIASGSGAGAGSGAAAAAAAASGGGTAPASGNSGGGVATAPSSEASSAKAGKSAAASPAAKATAASSSDEWTDEQDRQLQAGLAKFPASMDKNERWKSIAGGVTGKNKKECVQRFKAIREALKASKKG